MSSISNNKMGPVKKGCTDKIAAMVGRKEIREAAINKLHELHKVDKRLSFTSIMQENAAHHFEEKVKDQQIRNWSVYSHAEEDTAYGVNYFLKVFIGNKHYLHMRVHKQGKAPIYDFYSLHQTIKAGVETCIWEESDPLTYFNF